MAVAPLCAFVLGVCVLQWQAELPPALQLTLIAAAALVIGLLAWRAPARPHLALLLACVAAAALGFSYAGSRAQWRLADFLPSADEGTDVVVTGLVASLPMRHERGVRFEFEVEHHGTEVSVPRRLLLGWYVPGEPVRPGERWRFTVRLRRPHSSMNPGGFDLEAWMLERGLRASGYVRDPSAVAPSRLQSMVWTPTTAIERARAWLRDRLLMQVRDSRYGGVLAALVIGDQRAIADSDWTLFNRTGIAHLVSISGLHITMIAALVGGIVAAIWRRVPALLRRAPAQSAAIVAAVIAAGGYALLAGWGVPAQRTVLMLTTVAVAWLMRRRIGPFAALALAAAVVCVADPWAVTAAGFWLSFSAVAAIVWAMHGRPVSHGKLMVALKTAARVQLAVTIALIPITVLLFQQVSAVAPIANAIAIPLVSWAVTPLALVGTLAAALPPPFAWLAGPALGAANAVFSVVAIVLSALAAPQWAAFAVPAPPLTIVGLAICGAAWLLAPPGWPARGFGAVAMLPLFVWPGERPAPGALWVTALDVGQGSALVLETRDSVWLYDAGPRYSQETDAGERVVLPYLRSRGIGAVDGIVVSHLDQDHSGGAASILRGIEVRKRVSSIPSHHAALAGAEVEKCAAGMVLTSGALQLRVLHPTDNDYQRRLSTNAMSCVVLAQLGRTKLLLTGDLPAREEEAMIERELDLRARWLMVPHHGSRSSSSEILLDVVGPQIAAVQAGYRNRFGHPAPQVIDRYVARGIEVVRTDMSGAAQWRFAADGTAEFLSWRAIAVRYWHDRPGTGQNAPEDVDEEPIRGEDRGEPLFGMP